MPLLDLLCRSTCNVVKLVASLNSRCRSNCNVVAMESSHDISLTKPHGCLRPHRCKTDGDVDKLAPTSQHHGDRCVIGFAQCHLTCKIHNADMIDLATLLHLQGLWNCNVVELEAPSTTGMLFSSQRRQPPDAVVELATPLNLWYPYLSRYCLSRGVVDLTTPLRLFISSFSCTTLSNSQRRT
ncbi:unnamed protein product [Linum trigynum]|uniref:Uncharacterized protein n=1 Tax=Linum trigynum TaxID=586398 RepID=A0AAV2D5Z7_9ROSI